MSRVVHFEIHAGDLPRAIEFYRTVFDWQVEDWGAFVGAPYFGLVTGPDDQPGINGAILGRGYDNPEVGGPVAGAVITVQVDDFDTTAERILAAGGSVALPKMALTGMAWQGYFHDTENNVFGIQQPAPEAK